MNAKMDRINVIRMRFASIQKKVMVAFVKMDSMVMDSSVFKEMLTNVRMEYIIVIFIQVFV